MTNLHDIVETHVGNGSGSGAVGLVARGDRVPVRRGRTGLDGRRLALVRPDAAVARVGAADDHRPADAVDPWNVPGRYGWVGGTGTAAHITPYTGAVAILLAMVGPIPPDLMRDFWRHAAER